MEEIKFGSKGSDVLALQKTLKDSYDFDITCDGHYGKGTLRFVLWAKAIADLTPVDVVSEACLALMEHRKSWVGQVIGQPENRAVIAALEDVGLKEVPKGSNAGPFIQHITGGGAYPWCAAAVSYWLTAAKGTEINRRVWAVGELWDIIHTIDPRQIEEPHGRNAMAGDLVFMTRAGSGSDAAGTAKRPEIGKPWPAGSGDRKYAVGHVGIIAGFMADQVITVEGNVGDGVEIRFRKFSDLVALGYPYM